MAKVPVVWDRKPPEIYVKDGPVAAPTGALEAYLGTECPFILLDHMNEHFQWKGAGPRFIIKMEEVKCA